MDNDKPVRLQELLLARTRREFLRRVMMTGATACIAAAPAPTVRSARKQPPFVDVNVNLGCWPFRRSSGEEPAQLVARLRAVGVIQAWTGSLEGLLHKDVRAVNARLVEDCQRYGRGLLVPFGTINPNARGWEADLEHGVHDLHLRGIRLHPNYHGYRLDDPNFARLLQFANKAGILVQLALVMEDERMMHPLLRVNPVDPAPLTDLVTRNKGLRLVLINALRTLRLEALQTMVAAGNVSVEISMLEGVAGIANLLERIPAERVLFGSHAPVFYFEAAALKLKESLLPDEHIRAISYANAHRLLG